MKKSKKWIQGLLVAALAAGCAEAAPSPVVQSRKRGVCVNKLSAADFDALKPGVSWFYNWHHESADARPGMDFQPMVWTGSADRIAGARRYLDSKPKPRMLMGINEPNLSGQANLNPQKAAEVWKELSRMAKAKGVPLTGPHMAINAPGNEIVRGFDPIQNKERNLSYMIDFLDAFFHYAGKDSTDGIGIHAYGNIWELKWAVGELHKKYGKPIWVSEFAEWGARDAKAEVAYMVEAVDFMERSPHVAGYAWFKERFDKGPNKMSLLERESGKLTRLGELYVHMPVHDEAVFYPVPGRVEAEADVRMNGVGLEPTGDADGWFHVHKIDAGDWMEYQLNVAAAGTYTLSARLAAGAPVALRVTQGGAELGRILVAKPQGAGRWETAATTVRLAAGRQTIRVECGSKDLALNWLEFAR